MVTNLGGTSGGPAAFITTVYTAGSSIVARCCRVKLLKPACKFPAPLVSMTKHTPNPIPAKNIIADDFLIYTQASKNKELQIMQEKGKQREKKKGGGNRKEKNEEKKKRRKTSKTSVMQAFKHND